MIKLRKLQPKDADGMLEWMHDADIQRSFQIQMADKSREDILAFIEQAQTWPVDGKSIHYAIADEKDEYLGTISLKSISLRDKSAEYAISLRKKAQGRGVGLEATREILRMGFEIFGLERIYLNVLETNTAAIHLYEKCGFTFEGEFKKHLFVGENYHNLRWYAMLKEEYLKKLGGGITFKKIPLPFFSNLLSYEINLEERVVA